MKRRELLRQLGIVVGATLSGSLSRAVLAGITGNSQVDGAAALNTAEMALLAQVAEQIIPSTDTPGAIAAGVPRFISIIYTQWYQSGERARFLEGLLALEEQAHSQWQASFVDCTEQQQRTLLLAAEQDMRDPGSPVGHFFASMKELTITGYYTSEIGATQELIFNPVPLRYKGDYLFADVGRQWTP